MTVLENIAYPLRSRGIGRIERERLAKESVTKIYLDVYSGSKAKEPVRRSASERCLGSGLVREPDIFLMDEPLSNLDAKLRGVMRVEIKYLQRETNTTTVYVTHD